MGEESSWVGKSKVVVQTADAFSRSDFYIVDLKDEKISRLPSALFYHGLSGSMVVLNSSIYAIGSMSAIDTLDKVISKIPKGYNPFYDYIHRGSSVLDLKESTPQWTHFPETNHPRYYPFCATLGGNIYAFGGSKTGNPIGEVYEPKKRQWRVIAPPTTDDGRDWSLSSKNISFPVISDPKNNRLLVHFGIIPALYAFYPNHIVGHKWECLDKNITFPGGDPTEVVDDVIYFFIYDGKHGSITAYDIPTQKCLKVSWSSRFDNPSMTCYYMKRMFHLGNGILCLADSYSLNGITYFEFNRFKVERIDPGEVRVTPISVKAIPVEEGVLGASFAPL